MLRILLLLWFLQFIRYVLPNDNRDRGFSGSQSKLSEQFVSILTLSKSPVEMTIWKLGKNNYEIPHLYSFLFSVKMVGK
jgi:hypothetical protein